MRSRLVGKRRWLVLACALVIIVASTLGAAVGIGVRSPAPLLSLAMGMNRLDLGGLPPISRCAARDGAMVAYRAYPGNSEQVAILNHGSAGQNRCVRGPES